MLPALLRRLLLLFTLVIAPAAIAKPAALLFLLSDEHSAYESSAQVVARIDALRAASPDTPAAVLINGDLCEAGNPIARRTAGELDYAFLRALAIRVPVIFNLGNHDAEFSDLPTAIARLRDTGVTVISNLTDSAATTLHLGDTRLGLVGLATPSLNTYPAAIRDTLQVPDPAAWFAEHRFSCFAPGTLSVVLSHAGVEHDREILPLLPAGTLLLGGHNHLRFVHEEPAQQLTYVHVGCWNDTLGVARLETAADGSPHWSVTLEPIRTTDPVDPDLAAHIASVVAGELTAEDKVVIGHVDQPLAPADAARLAVLAVAEATGADAAFIGNTTFGAGLAAGPLPRLAFDDWVRFDGTLCTAEVSGAELARLLAAANPGPDTPFAERRGEFLYAAGPALTAAALDPQARYHIATNDWGARNSARYFDLPNLNWEPHPELKLKATAAAALHTSP